MNLQNPLHEDEFEDSIDLFDVALTLAENIKLLVLGPLLAGFFIYGITFLLPQKFQSTAVLRAEPDVSSYMTTVTVLDSSLANLGFLKDLSEEEAEEARIDLNRRVTTQIGRNDKLVTLNVTAGSPLAAQRMADEILKNTFAGLRPKGEELKRLLVQKALLQQQLGELQDTSNTAQKLLENSSPTADHGLLAESISSLSSIRIRLQETQFAVERRILGLTTEDLLQSPTLPKKPSAPKKELIAVLSALGTGLLLVVFVLMRHFWITSNTLEPHRDRLDALKRSYGLGR